MIEKLSENLAKTITLTDALSSDAIQIRLDALPLQQRLIQSTQNKENYDALGDLSLKGAKASCTNQLCQAERNEEENPGCYPLPAKNRNLR